MKKKFSTLGRVYRFSSAHRLHSNQLSDEENQAIYGKCNNLHGHGHNYIVEVTVLGPIDPLKGTICQRQEIDKTVEGVLEPLHMSHLDHQIPYFHQTPSTGENILEYLWESLDTAFKGVRLWNLRLWETRNNYFERTRD